MTKINEKYRSSIRLWLIVSSLMVLIELNSCENFQLPHSYSPNPCSDTVDTSSVDAGIFVSPHEVTVVSGTQQQFWPNVFEVSCNAVSYNLSKNLGSVSTEGLYTAPASLSKATDTLFLIVRSLAKRSLIDSVLIIIQKSETQICDQSNIKFSKDILPILEQHCLGCHSGERFARSGGGVNLDSVSNIKPYVNNGQFLASIDYSGKFKMPRQAPRLDSCSIRNIKTWIEKGALND